VLPEWRAAFERAAGAAVTMVIGESDTGKTSLVTALTNALVETGASVALVDADLGQSEIGPPTTVGLGRARRPLTRLREAEPVTLNFVGCTSPAGNLVGTLAGCGRLLQRARGLACRHIIVDTSGLIAGDIGRTLKQAKIDLLDPDLLICLERTTECETIVRPYLAAERPTVLRLPVASGVRRRSAEERHRHRVERLQAYFHDARTIRLDLRHIALRQPSRAVAAHRTVHYVREDFEGTLAGLTDRRGDTLGLGRIRDLDVLEHTLTLDTIVDPADVVAITLGRDKYPE
jgi:polynucleotide 5'-hydroxyl-kinase GRC3/NOL9